ncbi:hypothetical protein [Streptomyces tauricus]|uniref:hypothetical protein n=1 Tax=Streptomyces tauricus TaxID=68274 RepID=UPI00342D5B57
MAHVVERRESIRYDGMNGQQVAEEFLSCTLISDDADLLVFLSGDGEEVRVPQGHFVIRARPGARSGSVYDPDNYAQTFHEIA